MQHASWSFALAALILLPLGGWPDAQEPAPSDEAARAWREGPQALAERLTREIAGPWQLTDAELPGEKLAQGDVAGYALFGEGYMSLELHLRSNSATIEGDGIFFQSGMHRWRFDEAALLETVSLIGVDNFNEDEDFVFQSPGERRFFRATLSGDELALERVDTRSRLRFRRLGKLPFPGQDQGFDFYGRKGPIKQD